MERETLPGEGNSETDTLCWKVPTIDLQGGGGKGPSLTSEASGSRPGTRPRNLPESRGPYPHTMGSPPTPPSGRTVTKARGSHGNPREAAVRS